MARGQKEIGTVFHFKLARFAEVRLLFLAAAEPEQRVPGTAELKHPCPKAVF